MEIFLEFRQISLIKRKILFRDRSLARSRFAWIFVRAGRIPGARTIPLSSESNRYSGGKGRDSIEFLENLCHRILRDPLAAGSEQEIRLFACNKGYELYRACYMYQGCVYSVLQRQSFPFDATVSLVLFSSRGFCASQPRARTSHPETDEKQNKSGL